jgi:hypothetical protein
MNKLIKILHVDPSWKVIYILIRGGAQVKSAVSLETALLLLAKQKFDLILSEPQNIAIIHPHTLKVIINLFALAWLVRCKFV